MVQDTASVILKDILSLNPSSAIQEIAMQDMGVHLKSAKANALRTEEFLYDMNVKRGPDKVGVGYCPQPGIRHRMEEGSDTDREKIEHAELKPNKRDPESRQQYASILHNLQGVANAMVQSTMPWMKPMLKESAEWQKVYLPESGSISEVYPSITLGIQTGMPIHVDEGDSARATWGILGPVEICFPEFEVVLQLQSGDVLTFDASKVYHACTAIFKSFTSSIATKVRANMHI